MNQINFERKIDKNLEFTKNSPISINNGESLIQFFSQFLSYINTDKIIVFNENKIYFWHINEIPKDMIYLRKEKISNLDYYYFKKSNSNKSINNLFELVEDNTEWIVIGKNNAKLICSDLNDNEPDYIKKKIILNELDSTVTISIKYIKPSKINFFL